MNKFKVVTLAIISAAILGAASILSTTASTASEDQFDAAATYKAKCVACHGAKSEKKFDPAKADEGLVNAILKGQKGEKPPYMPAYEDKGITGDQAKVLVAHMRSLLQ